MYACIKLDFYLVQYSYQQLILTVINIFSLGSIMHGINACFKSFPINIFKHAKCIELIKEPLRKK